MAVNPRPRTTRSRRADRTAVDRAPSLLRPDRRDVGTTSFTALCPLRADVDSHDARRVVAGLQVGEGSPFEETGRTHFGRIQVLDSLMTDERRPLARPVMVVSADLDGDVRSYLLELLEEAGPVLAKVLALCDGAPADATAPDFVERATAHLLDHSLPIGLQYANAPGRTAADIRLAVHRHRRLAGFALGHRDDSPAELRAAFLDAFRPAREEAP